MLTLRLRVFGNGAFRIGGGFAVLRVGLAVLKAVLVTFFEHGGVPYYVIKKSSGVGFYGNSIIANKKY